MRLLKAAQAKAEAQAHVMYMDVIIYDAEHTFAL